MITAGICDEREPGEVHLNSYNLFYFDNGEKLFKARQMFPLCVEGISEMKMKTKMIMTMPMPKPGKMIMVGD